MSLTPFHSFELVLFHTKLEYDLAAVSAGVDKLIVDWETRGKEVRQAGFDTQINAHTPDDLRTLTTQTQAPVICRVNGPGPWTQSEIESAIACGAHEILLPMVRQTQDVEDALAIAHGRCGVGIMLETIESLEIAPALDRLPLTRVYVGLHDLSIGRHDPHLFAPLADGTVDHLRAHFSAVRFGFGGLTLPNLGYPLPCRLLISEMARLSTHFAFLRRSFVRDTSQDSLPASLAIIRESLEVARHKIVDQVQMDRLELISTINNLPASPWSLPTTTHA